MSSTVCTCEELVEDDGYLICQACGKVMNSTIFSHEEVWSESPNLGVGWAQLQPGPDWGKVERRIRVLGERLRFGTDCIDTATSLVKSILRVPRSGAVLESHCACCLLLASRREPQTGVVTLREVAAVAACEPQLVYTTWMRLITSLERDLSQPQSRRCSHMLQPQKLLHRYCDTLQAMRGGDAKFGALFSPSGSARVLAASLLEVARKEWILEGRSPQHVAAAAVLISAQAHRLSTTLCRQQLEMARSSKLDLRLSELKKVVLSLVRTLPGRKGLPDAVLLRSLPQALPEYLLKKTCAGVLLHKDGTAGAQSLQVQIPAYNGINDSDDSLPISFVASERDRARRHSKLLAASARIQEQSNANTQSTNTNSSSSVTLVLDQEELLIEEALRRGVPDSAIICGYFDSEPVVESGTADWVPDPDCNHMACAVEETAEPVGESDIPSELMSLYLHTADHVATRKRTLEDISNVGQ